ncbi:hypothetical protein LR48_Vigan08g090400 [Vigna angularis]|uniref:Uncharacterized protein n=1 Tax=Phaseolus angularis TaxID=3914 RepID=A0A0L9V559_PHAAN|nr:hypothetical protein LR48_Vigan08g090400 [Vigna angularis]
MDESDELVEIQTQCTFVAQGREDLLVAATGQLDRLGRVRTVGGASRLRDYFGPKPRSTKAMRQEVLSSPRQQMQVRTMKGWCFRGEENLIYGSGSTSVENENRTNLSPETTFEHFATNQFKVVIEKLNQLEWKIDHAQQQREEEEQSDNDSMDSSD